MPVWWDRKSHKNREDHHHQKSSVSPNSKKPASTEPNRSNDYRSSNNRKFDEAATVAVAGSLSPSNCNNSSHCNKSNGRRQRSRELGLAGGSSGGGSSGFSGLDSDGERRGHPLPRPSVSNDHHGVVAAAGGGGGISVGAGLGFGSGSSVSSVSSSGSADEQPPHLDPAQFGVSRGYEDGKLNVQPKSPGTRSRSPITSTLRLHNRSVAFHLESSTGSNGKSQCHPLPLPPSTPTSPPAMQNIRGSSVGGSTHNTLLKWKKGKLLGRGTFGHVYLGFNSEGGQMSGQFCAIKEVKVISDDQNSTECLKQLNQEITMLSQLEHPNIVQYFGSELGEETLSVYLEYVSGGSIYKLLQEYGPFKEPVIQNYTRQILSGLAYLHSRTTVHRDIKGANILVSTNGEIKLADFGMAKHITSCASVLSFKGSPYWMAPEVVMNTNGYNLAVDIWSLGCTIIEMASSKPPWSQYTGVAAIFKIGNSKDIPDIPEFLSNDAKSFVKLCLQRDPSARPTAAELLDHPFVRVYPPTRFPNINATAESIPFTFDSSPKPKALEIQPRRKSISSHDGDNIRRPVPVVSTAWSDSTKIITSLPVSPCSSPLRQYGTSSKSCLISPTHLAYTWTPQSSYSLLDRSLSPIRTNTGFTLDPWHETLLLRSQTPPAGSPRTRLI